MLLPELRGLLKQHHLKGVSYLNKSEIISLLMEKGILDSNFMEKEIQIKQELEEKMKRRAENKDERSVKLKSIRMHPRRVEILDRDTGEVVLYPSMYKAARAYGIAARVMSLNNGKLWRNRYEIKVYDD